MSQCPTAPSNTGHGRTHHRTTAANCRHCIAHRVLTVIEGIPHPPQEFLREDIQRQENLSDSRPTSAILLMFSRILVLRTRKGSYLIKPRRILPYDEDPRASGKRPPLQGFPPTPLRARDTEGGAVVRKILPYSRLTFYLRSARPSIV